MPWYTADLTAKKYERVLDALALLLPKHAANAAVFAHPAASRSGRRRIFFTPEASRRAARLLETCVARPCEPPSLENALLVAGNPRAWRLLA